MTGEAYAFFRYVTLYYDGESSHGWSCYFCQTAWRKRNPNLTAVELERIADLLRLGVNCQAIAARFSISVNRMTHLATELRRSGLEAPARVRA